MTDKELQRNAVTVDKTATEILKLQALSKEIADRLKEKREALLEIMQKTKTLTLKTELYTISRAKRVSTTIVSESKLEKDLKTRGVPVDYERRLSEQTIKAVNQLVKEGQSVEGVQTRQTEYLSIRSGALQK